MCVYICIYIYLCIYIYMYLYIYVYITITNNIYIYFLQSATRSVTRCGRAMQIQVLAEE